MSKLRQVYNITNTYYAKCVLEPSKWDSHSTIKIVQNRIYQVHEADNKLGLVFVETTDDFFGFYDWRFEKLENQKVAKLLYEQNNRLQD